jgi:16S rRNA (guanine966-N2)-methyltransferase
MKDRVREAVFNLIGPAVIDKFVIDLFAGTGALAFEALSRAAWRALAVERRFPTAGVIEKSASQLGIQDKIEVVAGDAFFWAERLPRSTSRPWLVFICPPYDLYVVSRSEMLTLIERLIAEAPIGSLFVLESDERFDPASLPNAEFWDLRDYSPARIAVFEKASRR